MAGREKVPVYSVNHVEDGDEEKINITVRLPGVQSASEFVVLIKPRCFHLNVPGRYLLDLMLGAQVHDMAEELRFVKKRSELRAVLRVTGYPDPEDDDMPSLTSSPVASAGEEQPDSPPRDAPALHDSFLEDANRLLPKTKPRAKAGSKAKGGQDAAAEARQERTDAAGGAAAPAAEWERPRRRLKKRPLPVRGGGSRSREARDAGESQNSDASSQEHLGDAGDVGQEQREWSATEADDSFGIPDRPRMPYAFIPDDEPASSAPPGPDPTPTPSTPAAEPWHSPENLTKAWKEGGIKSQAEGGPSDRELDERIAAMLHVMQQNAKRGNVWAEIEVAARQMGVKEADLEAYHNLCKDLGGDSLDGGGAGRQEASADASQPRSGAPSSSAANGGTSTSGQQKDGQWGRRSKAKAGTSATGRSEASRPNSAAPSPPPSPSHGQPREQSWQRTEQSGSDGKASGDSSSGGQRASGSSTKPVNDRPFGSHKWFAEFREKRKHYGTLRMTVLLVMVLVAVLGVDLLKLAALTAYRVYLVAPQLMPILLIRFRWVRAARSMQKRMQQSRVLEEGSRWTSCAILAVVVWYGLQIAWGLLWFGLELGLLIITWLLAMAVLLLYSAIWEPNFYASCVYSLILAFGSPLLGQRTFFLLTQALWPVPLVAYAGGGGLWGLAAAPVTLLFRFMWISPWFIIVGTFVCTCISSWTGWSWLQPLGVIACAFLLYDFNAFSRSSGSGQSRRAKVEVPEGVEGEVARVLRAADLYQVLEVAENADAEALKKAKRKKVLMTHPDKLGDVIGCNEAFARVTEAFDVLIDDKKRRLYNRELKHKQAYGEDEQTTASSGSQQSAGQDDTVRSMMLQCPFCPREHMARMTRRPIKEARWCASCKQHHSANEMEAWLETSNGGLFGRQTKLYARMGGLIVDISDMKSCITSELGSAEPDMHNCPYHFYTPDSAPRPGGGGTNRKKKGRRRG